MKLKDYHMFVLAIQFLRARNTLPLLMPNMPSAFDFEILSHKIQVFFLIIILLHSLP